MTIILGLVGGFVAGLIVGGGWRRRASTPVRGALLLVAGLGASAALSSPQAREQLGPSWAAAWMLSTAALLIVAAGNSAAFPGLRLVALGCLWDLASLLGPSTTDLTIAGFTPGNLLVGVGVGWVVAGAMVDPDGRGIRGVPRMTRPLSPSMAKLPALSFGVLARLDVRWLLLPYLAGTAVLVGLPALMSAGLSVFAYDALSPPSYVGLGNFIEIFNDPLFWVALGNSLFFIVLAVPLRLLGALALALLLNRPRRGVGTYRAGVYLPTVVPDVAYAFVWLWILNPLYGPLNLVLGALGLPTPAWLVEGETAKLGFVLMSLFQIGEGFVILLAGLQDVPTEYYEAASVDGASGVQSLRHITLPLLLPWMLLLTFRDVVLSFQYTFTPSYLMTGGDPYYSTLFLPLLIYEEAFDRFRFGVGSGLMLLMFLTTALVIWAVYRLLGRRAEQSAEI